MNKKRPAVPKPHKVTMLFFALELTLLSWQALAGSGRSRAFESSAKAAHESPGTASAPDFGPSRLTGAARAAMTPAGAGRVSFYARSSNNKLESLSVNGYTISPKFSAATQDYTVSVAYETDRLDLSYKTQHAAATVSVVNNSLTEGAVTVVSIAVTAENGAVRVYTVSAARAAAPKSSNSLLESLSVTGYALSPSFSPDRSDYTVSVPHHVSKLDLAYRTADPKSSVSVTGNDLAENAVTQVTVKVTAENGSTRSYTVRASRAAQPSADNRLESMSVNGFILQPAFSPEILEYSVSVTNATRKLEIFCRASDPKAIIAVIGNDLAENSTTTVSVRVTAENGIERIYKIRAHRPGPPPAPVSSNNFLASLKPSAGTLSPAFRKDTMRYALELDHGQDTVSFTTKPDHSKAKVTFTGPETIPPDGVSRFQFTVTAENGDKRVYTVEVTRSGLTPADPDDPDDPLTPADPGGEDGDGEETAVMLGAVPDTMVLPASLLNTLFRSGDSAVTLSNPVGQVTVASEGIRNVSQPYYDMTLRYSSRHDITADVPAGSLVVSTTDEGELFGDASFGVFVTLPTRCYVYSFNPDDWSFTLIAGPVEPYDGRIVFTSSRAGTFVLSSEAIAAARVSSDNTDDEPSKASDIRWMFMVSILGATFSMAYITGMLTTGKRGGKRIRQKTQETGQQKNPKA